MDEKDRKILEFLQEDALMPVADIAKHVGLSTTPCWRRIQKMEKEGVIRARVTLLDRKQANVPVTVFVNIRARVHDEDWLNAFKTAVQDIPEVVEAYRLAGETDYQLKIVVPDIDAYDVVYKQLISRVNFSDVSSSFAMEEMKTTTSMPLDYLPVGS